jgi:hypothetical protein
MNEDPGFPENDPKKKQEVITRKQKAHDLKEEKAKNDT